MRLFCKIGVNKTIEWLKDGKPIYVDYDHVIFVKDDLIIRDPLSHHDNGNYTCNGKLIKTINIPSPVSPPSIAPKIKKNDQIRNQTNNVLYSFLKYQSENPLVVVLCVGLLAIVLMYIFSKIAAIYTEASINYAKYKFVKKGLDLKNKIEELKVTRKKKPQSVITKESNRFTRLIEDEKWSLIL